MKDQIFNGLRAVVTGGSQGIGRAISEKLLDRGCEVVIVSRTLPDNLRSRDRVSFISHDFSEPFKSSSVSSHLWGLDRLDLLVNNLGVYYSSPTEEISESKRKEIFDLNFHAAVDVTNCCLGSLRRSRSPRILNISSIAAYVTRVNSSIYSATKSALVGWSRSLAIELAPEGILVNTICPGPTETDMLKKNKTDPKVEKVLSSIPIGRAALPEEIAEHVIFFGSPKNTFITGQSIVVDGAFSKK